jgi:hypothetical protein
MFFKRNSLNKASETTGDPDVTVAQYLPRLAEFIEEMEGLLPLY